MIERAQWPYWMAAAILVAATAVLFWPPPSEEANVAVRAAPRRAVVASIDERAATRATMTAERLVFRGQTALAAETTLDAPPSVLGVARVGRRGFAYLAGGEGAGRLAIGQSSGGWILSGVGANYAEFSRSGEVRRVRLFTEGRAASPGPASQQPESVAPSVIASPPGVPAAPQQPKQGG